MTSQRSPAGARTTVPAQAGAPAQALEVLLTELAEAAAERALPLQHLVDLVHPRLSAAAGVRRLVVLADPTGSAGPTGSADAGGELVLAQAGPTLPGGPGLRLALRHAGADVGHLLLEGGEPASLPRHVLATVAHHLAAALHAVAALQEQRQFSAAGRVLFERGARAAGVEAAGRVLAEVTAQTLRTEVAAVHLVDAATRATQVLVMGVPAEVEAQLSRSLVGRVAGDSPAWRRVRDAGTDLVDDASTAPVRPGGFIRTLGLLSFAAISLLSADGVVGTVVCGDTTRRRTWTASDRELAHRLALGGAVVVDNARLREAERAHLLELEHRAFHDALTGLANRAALLRDLEDALGAGERRAALLLVDLDGFKQVNDALGHHAGDVLLQLVAGRLRELTPPGALAARLGGDELAVLLPGAATAAQVRELARRVHLRLREPFEIEGRTVRTGASVGAALAPEHAADVTGLLRAADAAMYCAKRGGDGPVLAPRG
ncbi:diguanylate cyclase domain-containing protein [Kineococcus indalonis]|uniref:diguanylate cyclase domain-containing protein n=1 Tax=Kineococcus indalonis TaxID=2696566 RepID=UPI00141310FF|nr:sensor domain-containing diguanylate cyclase [Kineococcus indalonis]NAZ88196.1 diguanylate cyclase [Kineococcus indalonis]